MHNIKSINKFFLPSGEQYILHEYWIFLRNFFFLTCGCFCVVLNFSIFLEICNTYLRRRRFDIVHLSYKYKSHICLRLPTNYFSFIVEDGLCCALVCYISCAYSFLYVTIAKAFTGMTGTYNVNFDILILRNISGMFS